MEDGYTRVCTVSELTENKGKRFLINDVEVAVFKVNGEVYILNNTCPHQHTSVIYDGFIERDCVVCPAHGWMFNLKTGKLPTGARGLDSYQVKTIDDEVFAIIKPKKLNW